MYATPIFVSATSPTFVVRCVGELPRLTGDVAQLTQGLQSASAECMEDARQELDAAIEAVGTKVQSTTLLVLDMAGAGACMQGVQDIFEAGIAEGSGCH